MPSSLIVSALGGEAVLGAFGVAAVRLASAIAISSLIARDQTEIPQATGSTGGLVQLPPATDNKLPVVYGDAWVSPIVVDAKISTDQQTMWYVLAFSETTDTGTISFDQVYWDDKLLIFDPANPTEIRGWYDNASNTTITGPGGKISCWFYRNGSIETGTTHHCVAADGTGSEQPTTVSAISVLQDEAIDLAQRWTNNHSMTKTVFMVMRVKYDSDHGITNLGQIKARIRNTLKQPGSVIKDYLTNTRYGAGVDVSNVNLTSLAALDTYSAQTISLTNTTGGTDSGVRYTINGIIDTKNDCLSNLVTIADCCDSWLQWDEAKGQWGALMNRSLTDSGQTTSTMTVVTGDQIIGGIDINPLDLNSTYNAINVQFPNSIFKDANGNLVADLYRGQNDFRYYSLPTGQRFANEPENNLTVNLPLVNNSLQATYVGYKKLFASRSDLIITFTMDYSGIQIDAGDIIAIKHDWYGWDQKSYGGSVFPGKPFRVTQVKEFKNNDGFLSAQITATAYNDSIYTTTNPHYFTKVSFTGLLDPSYISTPVVPTFPTALQDPTNASFVVQGLIPEQGNVEAMEFWYSSDAALGSNNYTLYATMNYTSESFYPHKDNSGNTYFEQVKVTSLPAGTYYWRSRARGPYTATGFSDASTAFTWAPSRQVDGTNILDNSIAGSKVISGDPQKAGTNQGTGFFDNLGSVALASLGAASVYYGYKKGVFNDILPEEWRQFEGYKTDILNPKVWTTDDVENATPGSEVTYVADATPPVSQQDWLAAANFDDYDVPPYDGDIYGDYFG